MDNTNPSIRLRLCLCSLFTDFAFAIRMSDQIFKVFDRVGYLPHEDDTPAQAAKVLRDLADSIEQLRRDFDDPDADDGAGDWTRRAEWNRLPGQYLVYWGREGNVVQSPSGALSPLISGDRAWSDTLAWAYADLLDVSHEPPASSDPVVWDLDAQVQVGAPTEEILAAERAGRVGTRFEYRGRRLLIERDEHVHDFDG